MATWTRYLPWPLLAGLAGAPLLAVPWLDAGASAPVGALVALVHLLVLPGFLLVWMLFPERSGTPNGLTGAERVALAVLGSLSLVVGLAFILAVLEPSRLSPKGLAVGLAILEGILAILATARHYDAPANHRLGPSRANLAPGVAANVVLVAALACTGVAFAYFMLDPSHDAPFTEAVLLGAAGTTSCYPNFYLNGTYVVTHDGPSGPLRVRGCPFGAVNVTLELRNHEGQPMSYLVQVGWTRGTAQDAFEGAAVAEFTLDVAAGANGTQSLRLPDPPGVGHFVLAWHVFENPSAPRDVPYRVLGLRVEAN